MSFTHYRTFADEASAKAANAEIELAKGIPSAGGATLRWSDVEEAEDGRFLIASPDRSGEPVGLVVTKEAAAEAAGDAAAAAKIAARRLARRDRPDFDRGRLPDA